MECCIFSIPKQRMQFKSAVASTEYNRTFQEVALRIILSRRLSSLKLTHTHQRRSVFPVSNSRALSGLDRSGSLCHLHLLPDRRAHRGVFRKRKACRDRSCRSHNRGREAQPLIGRRWRPPCSGGEYHTARGKWHVRGLRPVIRCQGAHADARQGRSSCGHDG